MCGVFPAIMMFVLAGSGVTLHAAVQHDYEAEEIRTVYRFNNDGTGQTTTYNRWRALTAAGRGAISQFSFPYASEFDSVRVDFFRTLKKDGSVLEGDSRQTFDTTPPLVASAPLFSDLKQKTIVLPNVELGDSVEYQMVIERRLSPKPGDFWVLDKLRRNVAVALEITELDLPADRKIALHEFVPHTSDVREGGRRKLGWRIPSRQPGSPLDAQVEPAFAASTILSWDELGTWLRSLQEPSQTSPEIQALASKLTAGKNTERERIDALYSYVAENIRYVGVSFGLGAYQPHKPSEVLRNKYGDCKDKHVLLMSLLRAAGIQADAVLMFPGVGLVDEAVPMPIQFAHEFTSIQTKGGRLFLDTTLELAPPQVLMPGVRGRKALLIGDKHSTVIDIPPESSIPDRIESTITASIDASGEFAGTSRVELSGSTEVVFRRLFRDGTAETQEQSLRQFYSADLPRASISKVEHSDPSDLSSPFWFQWSISDPAFLPNGDPSKRISLPVGDTGDPKKLSTIEPPSRPIHTEKGEVRQVIDLKLHPALTISAPMPVDVNTAFVVYHSEANFINGRFRAYRSIRYTGAAIMPSDWKTFLDFTRQVQESQTPGFLIERPLSTDIKIAPPQVNKSSPGRIQVSGNLQAANLIRKLTPAYPPLAKQGRVQGTVRFEAIVAKDGTIQSLQLISGHPLLLEAANGAVKQWLYQPTLWNGEPVEVITQIDVNFTLEIQP